MVLLLDTHTQIVNCNSSIQLKENMSSHTYVHYSLSACFARCCLRNPQATTCT